MITQKGLIRIKSFRKDESIQNNYINKKIEFSMFELGMILKIVPLFKILCWIQIAWNTELIRWKEFL